MEQFKRWEIGVRFVTECEESLKLMVSVDGAKLAGKTKGNRHLERHKRRWNSSTKINLMGAGYMLGEWIKLTDNMAFWSLGFKLGEP